MWSSFQERRVPPLPGPAARGRAALLGAPAGPGLGLGSKAAG